MEAVVYAALCALGEEHEAAYRLLALALHRERGITPLPAMAREERGKPYFPDHPEVCFNVSHSHGGVACAIHDLPVGVDIERLRPAPKRLAAGLSDMDFFRDWTVREATVKRRGEGVAALLHGKARDPLCQTNEILLPGFIIALCPSDQCAVRWVAATIHTQ